MSATAANEFDWLDDDDGSSSLSARIVALRAERLELDHDGIRRLGSHRAVLQRVAEIDAELRRLEYEQDRATDKALDLAESVAECASKGIVASRLPSDIVTRAYPPRRYAVQDYFPMQACSLLVAEGSVGKSTLALQAMLHVAAGLPFLGHETTAGPVVYFSAEDDQVEVERRAQKILRRMPPDAQRRAIENFHLIDAVSKRLYFVVSKDGVAKVSDVVARISEYIAASFPDTTLVVVDTVSRINGANENSNEVMACIVDAAELIARPGPAVLLLHHVAKGVAREGIDDLHAGRGGAALGDNARAVLRLMPATHTACKGLDISPESRARGDVLRLIHAKHNYGRRQDPVWLNRLADGVLEPFEPAKLDVAARSDQLVEQLVKWAVDSEPFGKSEITRDPDIRASIWGSGVSKDAAVDAFERAIEEHQLVEADAKVKGRPRYTANPATAERLLLEAKELEDRFALGDEA